MRPFYLWLFIFGSAGAAEEKPRKDKPDGWKTLEDRIAVACWCWSELSPGGDSRETFVCVSNWSLPGFSLTGVGGGGLKTVNPTERDQTLAGNTCWTLFQIYFLIYSIYNRCLGHIMDEALWIWVGWDFTWNARTAAVGGARLWRLEEDRKDNSSRRLERKMSPDVLAERGKRDDSLPVALFLKGNRLDTC